AEALSLLNAFRLANGLPALTTAGDAMAKAQVHAEAMAAAGDLWHSNPLAAGIDGGWTAIAENVGNDESALDVHNLLVASSTHRANMLGEYNQVGVGAAVGPDGYLYVSQVFVAR
ncbi:MAG: CAP domain-containing protein, partial [Acidimicrobiales bacterium]